MPHKTALVTGANKGIGFEIARQLTERSFHVILSGRNEARIHEAVNSLQQTGASCAPLVMDVGDKGSIESAHNTLAQQNTRLDVLINNAAILLDHSTSFLNASPDMIEDTVRINSLGPLYVTRAFLPLLDDGSRVINVSSSAGQICGGAGAYAPVYSMSKTLLNAISMQLSSSLQSRNIAVNAMCPGWVRTEMGGSNAPRSLAEGADTAVWLATDAPLSVNGQFIKDRKHQSW